MHRALVDILSRLVAIDSYHLLIAMHGHHLILERQEKDNTFPDPEYTFLLFQA
jgi:hypothetical protein